MKNRLSQLDTNNLEALYYQLTLAEQHIFDLLVNWFATHRYAIGGITLAQATMADDFITRETANRIVQFFKKLGIITTEKRPYTSNVTKPTPWWFTPHIQAALKKMYKRYPKGSIIKKVTLTLGMLFCVSENNSQNIRNNIGRLLGKDIKYRGYQRRDENRIAMKQKIDKVLGIRAALLKRGESEPIDPYKLMAFSDGCLDECIAKMRFSKPKYPYRFFLAQALDWCKYNNQEPDWILADALRMQRIPEFENSRPDSAKASWKSGKPVNSKSPEQIRSENEEHQKRERMESSSLAQSYAERKRRAETSRFEVLSLDEKIEHRKRQLSIGSFLSGLPESSEGRRQIEEELAALIAQRDTQKSTEVIDPVLDGSETPQGPPSLNVGDFSKDLSDPYVQLVVKGLVANLQKVSFESEEGKAIRARLGVYGIPIPSVGTR